MSGPSGSVEGIFISPRFEELPGPVEEVEVVPGKGIRGDRYFVPEGRAVAGEDAGYDLTLIEAEALEALVAEQGIELSAAESRRNVLTRGIGLNDLVGQALPGRRGRVRGGRAVRALQPPRGADPAGRAAGNGPPCRPLRRGAARRQHPGRRRRLPRAAPRPPDGGDGRTAQRPPRRRASCRRGAPRLPGRPLRRPGGGELALARRPGRRPAKQRASRRLHLAGIEQWRERGLRLVAVARSRARRAGGPGRPRRRHGRGRAGGRAGLERPGRRAGPRVRDRGGDRLPGLRIRADRASSRSSASPGPRTTPRCG